MGTDYFDQLKDPRWQKKRLQILERDNWTCVNCGGTESTLHVHHGCYIRDRPPWEHPDDTLWTLCEECHEVADEFRHDGRLMLGRIHPKAQGDLLCILNSLPGLSPKVQSRFLSDVLWIMSELWRWDRDRTYSLGDLFQGSWLESLRDGSNTNNQA